jgi:hypothetical protein
LRNLARAAAAQNAYEKSLNKAPPPFNKGNTFRLPVQREPNAPPLTSEQKIMYACKQLLGIATGAFKNTFKLHPPELLKARECASRKRKNTNRNKTAAKTIRTAVNNANRAAKAANKAAANATIAAMNVNAVANRNQGAGNLKYMANTKVPFSNRNNHNTRKPNNPKRARLQ